MFVSKFNQFIQIALFLIFTFQAIVGLAAPDEQDQQANEISNSITKQNGAQQVSSTFTKYDAPFLVLMSSNEISVAQFPLIENGRISVAYRLSDSLDRSNSSNENEQRFEDTEEENEDSDGGTKSIYADAREYEQQMPSSQILGKFEPKQQHQIAAASSSSNFNSGGREEVDTSNAAEQGERGNQQEVIRPRIRRSSSSGNNNLTEDHGNRKKTKRSSSNTSNGTTDGNNNSTNANAVMKSSSYPNVTSAQFSTNITRIEQGNRGNSPEEAHNDDKISVSFSDFDVHMALGYAFVSDSTGRIHRFGLGNSLKSRGYSNENLVVENDYTYTIDAASKPRSGFLPRFRTTERKSASPDSSENNVSAVHNESSAHRREDAATSNDDANKVSPGNVAQRQSGRHPTASGPNNLLAESDGVTTTNSFMVSGSSETPIFDNLKSGYSNAGSIKIARKLRRFDGSKPRIIWSRTKHGFSAVSHSPQQSFLEPPSSLRKSGQSSTGAFPIQPPNNNQQKQQSGELVVGGDSSDENQMAGDTVEQHMGGADGDGLQSAEYRGEEPAIFGGSGEQTSAATSNPSAGNTWQQQQRKAINREKLRTEIAVDWLNNLLFVLDKYCLLVVDFDGDNELVLIDDFNINNRPIDIKVDPINGFLFWLQVGTFHNTIYKLDFGILSKERDGNTLKLTNQASRNGRLAVNNNQANVDCSSELALISHHYAHPIITNLPQHTKIFTIDHKHSKIYVPLAPTITDGSVDRNNKTHRDDAEVFATVHDDSKAITHMNSTSSIQMSDSIQGETDKNNCNTSEFASTSEVGQILAYNLDGTDVGPLRSDDQRSHLLGFDGMHDITFDNDKGLLYWLTNDGREIFEEIKSESDHTFSSGQHLLDGKKYLKMKLFDDGSNQPSSNIRPRLLLLLPTSTNRQIRSDKDRIEDNRIASSLDGRHRSGIAEATRFSRNAPFIILGITCLVVLSVYLIYAFVFQRVGSSSSVTSGGSMAGSSIVATESRADSRAGPSEFLGGASTISRWIAKPPSRSMDNSTFNRDFGGSDRPDCYDIESTNYNTSNAIDEHYRDVINNQALFDLDTDRLANLGEWPTNMHDMSNKLYVPVEVLQDEALSSIHRISIDQLEIERRNPLGEGHFGTVLQGAITCKIDEKNVLLDNIDKSQIQNSTSYASSMMAVNHRRSVPVPSSTSSGHGSSSTSSDFVTATSCTEATNGDYLTPKSHCTSTASDYLIDNATSSRPDSCSSYTNQEDKDSVVTIETRFKVAIKKLKDNASMEEKRDFLQEAKLLAKFNHPNIIHLIGICLDRGSTLIVMELMLGGDLIRYMQENTPMCSSQENLTEDDLLTICLDIVNGCCYLEERNHIHRDIAARNCLVSSRMKEERVVKLADFGLARDIYKDSYYKKLNDSAMPLKWMAPECLIEQKFTIKSDVWSFGVVMWEVMSYCQEKPYGGIEPFLMKEHLISGARLRKPEKSSDNVYRLMNECWQLQPEDRPTFQECRAVLIEIKNGTTRP